MMIPVFPDSRPDSFHNCVIDSVFGPLQVLHPDGGSVKCEFCMEEEAQYRVTDLNDDALYQCHTCMQAALENSDFTGDRFFRQPN